MGDNLLYSITCLGIGGQFAVEPCCGAPTGS